MRGSNTRFFKQSYLMLVFAAFIIGCSSFPPIDTAAEKPITDVKSIAGTWLSVGQWCPPGSLPIVVYATIYFKDDGSSLLYSESEWQKSGPWYYKGQLQNGKLRTVNGEYTLYEHEGKQVLTYRGYDGNFTARLEPANIGKSSPFEDKKKYKPFYFDIFRTILD